MAAAADLAAATAGGACGGACDLLGDGAALLLPADLPIGALAAAVSHCVTVHAGRWTATSRKLHRTYWSSS